MTLISGVLKGPYGDSRSGVTITMRSMKTSSTVLNLAKSQSITDDTGRYSLNVEPGVYEVIISVYGAQPERVGMIEVYADSLPGTLNDFLRRPGESDITPEIVQTVDHLRAEAAASAAAAKVSEKNAEATLASAVKKGDYGVGGSSKGFMASTSSDLMKACKERGGGFVRNNTGTAGVPTYGAGVYARSEDTNTLIVASYLDANLFVLACSDNSINDVKINRIWGSVNTTVDSNGFIKKASPIARLSGAPEKMTDDYLDGFTLAGSVAVNSEAEGVSADRVSVGVYKITGSLGFAEEGWNIEVPQDVNGNRLCFVETSTGKDGTIYVKVSKRRFDIDTAAIVAGDPMDIPDGRWIDLRLEMPVREVVEEPIPDVQELLTNGPQVDQVEL